MENEWTINKHAVITGASDGIGKELSMYLARKCRKLTLISYTQEKLESLEKELSDITDKQSEIQIESYAMDIRDTEKMKNLVNKIYNTDKNQVDMFINCAGGSHVIKPLEQMTYADIDRIFDVNAKAPLFWLRELLPYIKNNKIDNGSLKRGHVIMMSSRSAERALPYLSVYASAKGAVDKFIEALQREYAQYRLAFTLVSPGSINTSFTAEWPPKDRDAHNLESMAVKEAVGPIIQALNAQYATNRISYESTTQWLNELGVLKSSSGGTQ